MEKKENTENEYDVIIETYIFHLTSVHNIGNISKRM